MLVYGLIKPASFEAVGPDDFRPDEKELHEAALTIERTLDACRPEEIAAAGIARRTSISVYPDEQTLRQRYPIGFYVHAESRPGDARAIGLPEQPGLRVFDASILQRIHYAILDYETYKLPVTVEAIARRHASTYWESGVALDEYRADKPAFAAMMSPEVLYPLPGAS